MGIVSNRLVRIVNQTPDEDTAKEAVFDYLNAKVRPRADTSLLAQRLHGKFLAAQCGFTQHGAATHQAYAQFMQAPAKLECSDRQTAKKIGRAQPAEVPKLVNAFVYRKLLTRCTITQNQQKLRGWAAILGSRLTHHHLATAQAFEACSTTDALDEMKTLKSRRERAAAVSTGIAVGLAI